jgi:hypothetical protein
MTEEVGLFAQSVSMRLKANLLAELTRTIEDEMVPWLRKRTGFRDQVALAVPGGAEAVAISLGEKKEYAKAYNRETPPPLQKTLKKFIEGPRAIQTYEVTGSTFHPIAAPAAVSSSVMSVR